LNLNNLDSPWPHDTSATSLFVPLSHFLYSSSSCPATMARSKRRKSSVSVRISRPHAATHHVPIARTVSVHRNTNGRLGTSTSHVSCPETSTPGDSTSTALENSDAGVTDGPMDVDPANGVSESGETDAGHERGKQQAQPVWTIHHFSSITFTYSNLYPRIARSVNGSPTAHRISTRCYATRAVATIAC
jgi:hypothetical protein